jgi:hypothetical protein
MANAGCVSIPYHCIADKEASPTVDLPPLKRAVATSHSRPTGAGGGLLSERPVYRRNLTFADAVKRLRVRNYGRSGAPPAARDRLAAERLHPKVAN